MMLVSLDPSGNSSEREGSGTTGVAVFKDGELFTFLSVKAEDFKRTEAYWDAVRVAVSTADVIVCESYRLFGHKAKEQTGSSMETAQLIGYLRMQAWDWGVPFVLQDPSIKVRFSDDVLVETGFAELRGGKHYVKENPSSIHERDAIRHGLYYLKYGKI